MAEDVTRVMGGRRKLSLEEAHARIPEYEAELKAIFERYDASDPLAGLYVKALLWLTIHNIEATGEKVRPGEVLSDRENEILATHLQISCHRDQIAFPDPFKEANRG